LLHFHSHHQSFSSDYYWREKGLDDWWAEKIWDWEGKNISWKEEVGSQCWGNRKHNDCNDGSLIRQSEINCLEHQWLD
jgi:hypothetical protein